MRVKASLGALLVTWSSPTVAAERVALLLPSCELPGVSAAALREAVALDLQPDGLALAPAGELSPGRDVEVLVEVACPAPDELTLRAERGNEQQRRTLRLSELAEEQRPRALSLALTELVSLVLHPPMPPSPRVQAEAEAEPAGGPAPAPAPAPAGREPPAPSEASAPPEAANPTAEPPTYAPREQVVQAAATAVAWRVGLAPELRLFQDNSLWGLRLQLRRGRVQGGMSLLAARGQATTGSVSTRLVQASLGYAVPLWGDSERTVLETGLRAGGGYTFMSSHAHEGALAYDARDWYVDGAWTVRAQTAVSPAFCLGLGAELGYGRGPIGYADNDAIARTSGAFASFIVDVSYRLRPRR